MLSVTKNTDDNTTHTKIIIHGNICSTANAPGSIQCFATGTDVQFFLNFWWKIQICNANNGNVYVVKQKPHLAIRMQPVAF